MYKYDRNKYWFFVYQSIQSPLNLKWISDIFKKKLREFDLNLNSKFVVISDGVSFMCRSSTGNKFILSVTDHETYLFVPFYYRGKKE